LPKTYHFLLENTCCKATINQITYLTLLKIPNRKELFSLQCTMVMCQSFYDHVICNLTKSQFATAACGHFLTVVHQIFCSTYLHQLLLNVHKFSVIPQMGCFIEWDPLLLKGNPSQSVRPDSLSWYPF